MFGWIITSPVVSPPNVNVCCTVVPSVPVALRYAPPAAPADTEAVGVPELTLRTANFAEVVAALPIRRSKVSLIGEIAPDDVLQFDPPLEDDQLSVPDPFVDSVYPFDPSAEGKV